MVTNRGSHLVMTKKEIVKRQKEIKIRLTDEEHQALFRSLHYSQPCQLDA